MKKILIMLFALVILMCSCGKQENPTETDAPGESESVPASEQTEPTPVPTSPTSEPPTEPVTQPEQTEPAPTEPPKDDLSYYPYPLLDMTYGEVAETFGDLTPHFGFAGGASPYISQLKMSVDFGYYNDEVIPDDVKPSSIFIRETMEKDIYPGLNVGMSANEIPDNIQFYDWGVSPYGEGANQYIAIAEFDSYLIYLYFKIPEEILEKYGDLIERSEEEQEQFDLWGEEYKKEILNTDRKVEEIIICFGNKKQ